EPVAAVDGAPGGVGGDRRAGRAGHRGQVDLLQLLPGGVAAVDRSRARVEREDGVDVGGREDGFGEGDGDVVAVFVLVAEPGGAAGGGGPRARGHGGPPVLRGAGGCAGAWPPGRQGSQETGG